MNNRLDSIFGRKRKVLVTYLCVGDPSIEESVALAKACVRKGADVIELGVPFSDPTADGLAIARASQRAILAGGGLEATLRAARALRASDADVGLVLFGYYNPIFVHGEERTARAAADAGVDALLVVDLPLEESHALREAAAKGGVGFVPLLAPTSRADRVAAVKAVASSGHVPFVYYVSMTGVTGSDNTDLAHAGARAGELRKNTGLPVVVGFGIDSRAKARDAARLADGVVVGTAIVRAIEQAPTAEVRLAKVEAMVTDFRAGIDETATSSAPNSDS
jgi:tryptophan synthase alpha chain